MGFADTAGGKQQQVFSAVQPAGVVIELLDLVPIEIEERPQSTSARVLGSGNWASCNNRRTFTLQTDRMEPAGAIDLWPNEVA